MLLKNRPAYHSDQLLCYLPGYAEYDYSGESIMPVQARRKTVFMMLGSIEPRKGQDSLVQAIRLLPANKLQDSFLLFVGQVLNQSNLEAIQTLQNEHPEQVCYLGEVGLERM